MTTNSEPKKFRLRRSDAAAAASDDVAANTHERPEEAVTSDGTAPTRASVRVAKRDTASATDAETQDVTGAAPQPNTDLAAIRREGLTGRQLRMARRLAQKQNLTVTSDFDAVRQLRLAGIDPFERANMLELFVPDGDGPAQSGRVQLPQTMQPHSPPSTDVDSSGPSQISQIAEIQRDIARRRRRKLVLLFGRLAFFVGLPTLLAGFYYFSVATPMYATKAEFVIQQAESSGAAMGGLFSGTGFATSQDSITVQSYLTSRDAMLRLDQDADFKAHFSQDWIDPIQRLEPNATNEQAYAVYQDNVQIGYDPTEGIIKMEVIAASPEVSAEYSSLLIAYAEERVDQLTQRLREDQMSGARDSFEESEEKMLAAQNSVLVLQEQLGVLDPVAESGSVMSQVTGFQTQLQEKRLELAQLNSNPSPNAARVAGVEGDIARLQSVIAELRSEMTDGTENVASLAKVSAQLRIAETDLQTRTALMQQALQQLETARIEANRQVRYLSLGVSPIPPDEPTYPRAFENTLLAFLIFSGIYLMLSLTASILREQVSS